MFNLTQCRQFPSKQTGLDIYCSDEVGPCFTGYGDSDLCAEYEPFNEEKSCCSWGNSSGYGIPVNADGINMLTNEIDGEFTITELEVWEVTYID